jgi:adenylate cyclase
MSEIERKWSVRELPADLPSGDEIRQGYVALDDDVEVRIRDRGGQCSLTVKGGAGLERSEVEVDLDRDGCAALWPLTRGRAIEKTRHVVEVGDHKAEIDVYRGDLDGLRTVEVEFDAVEDAESFEPPDWFGEERWSNRRLAVDGRPAADC